MSAQRKADGRAAARAGAEHEPAPRRRQNRRTASRPRRRRWWRWRVSPIVVIVVLLVLCFWDIDYQGRTQIVSTQRAACQKAIPSRFSSMESWYGASVARHDDAVKAGEGPAGPDSRASATYRLTVLSLMQLVDRAHSLVWPDPHVPGTRGPYAHPLGYADYSCRRAYPDPSIFDFFG